jgi:hypothetical protein
MLSYWYNYQTCDWQESGILWVPKQSRSPTSPSYDLSSLSIDDTLSLSTNVLLVRYRSKGGQIHVLYIDIIEWIHSVEYGLNPFLPSSFHVFYFLTKPTTYVRLGVEVNFLNGLTKDVFLEVIGKPWKQTLDYKNVNFKYWSCFN